MFIDCQCGFDELFAYRFEPYEVMIEGPVFAPIPDGGDDEYGV